MWARYRTAIVLGFVLAPLLLLMVSGSGWRASAAPSGPRAFALPQASSSSSSSSLDPSAIPSSTPSADSSASPSSSTSPAVVPASGWTDDAIAAVVVAAIWVAGMVTVLAIMALMGR